MAEEFLQAGICAGPWWMMNSSKGMFGGCSPPIGDVGSFGWGADVVDIKPRPSCEESSITSASDGSMAFPSCQKPDSDSSGGDVLIDSTFPIMGFALSSSTTSDWNPSLLRASGRAEKYYNSTIHEEMNPRLNCHQETVMDSSQINNDWSPGDNYSSTNDFLLDQPKLNSVTSSGSRTAGFPVGSVSSVLLKSLFEPDHPQPQQPLFNNQSMNYMSNDQLSPSWPKLQPSLFRPSLPKQQQTSAAGGLHFSNNTTFWNPTTAAGLNDGRTNFLPPTQPQFLLPTFEEKARCPTLTTKTEEVRELGMMKKGRTEPAIKRPRIEAPSPLTTFKVRKEKLGDRITALQQLVSPFGKTDTASVLHEAIEYIKFLHDQVNVLSTPYMKQGAPIQHQQGAEKLRDLEQDLRSRGLCLVPISSTFPVANETTADFWTLTFGGLSGR